MALRPLNLKAPQSPLAVATLALLIGTLGACRNDRVETTGSLYPHDVRARHPLVLADGTRTLDIFPTGPGHLDPRQAADLEAFLLEFRRYGRGSLAINVPHGLSPDAGVASVRTGTLIRRVVAASGIPSGTIILSGYPIADPALVSPIRLSFERMEAKVASACGLWPQDFGVGSPAFNLRNEPSWNLGCATRSNLAAQVADPIDLVRSRPEGRIDTVRRSQVLDKLRQGNDPSTKWQQDGRSGVKDAISQ